MALVEVYCLIKKRVVRMDRKLADALVKMKRARYDIEEPIKPAQARRSYQTKVVIPEQTPLVADTPILGSFHPDYSQEQVEIEQPASEVVDVINPIAGSEAAVVNETTETVVEDTPKKRGRRKKDAEIDSE